MVEKAMSAGPASVLRRHPEVHWEQLGNALVILDGSGQTLRGLNRTGARVWELIDGKRSLESIAAQLASETQQPLETVLRDVVAFANERSHRGLVAEAGPAKASQR